MILAHKNSHWSPLNMQHILKLVNEVKQSSIYITFLVQIVFKGAK